MNGQQLDEFLDRYPGIGIRVEREAGGRVTLHTDGPPHLRQVLTEELERTMPVFVQWRVLDDAEARARTPAERQEARRAQRAAARQRVHGTPPPAPTRDAQGRIIPRAGRP